MQDGSYIIGRTPATRSYTGGGRLNIDDATVSHRHAALLVLQGTYYLADLGSHNGTWRLREGGYRPHTEGYVDPQEPLRFGETEVTLAELMTAESPEV